jgi:ABC-type anion transport system duplicated permease subunit
MSKFRSAATPATSCPFFLSGIATALAVAINAEIIGSDFKYVEEI